MSYEALFLEQIKAIDHVIDHVCRRNRLGSSDAEEFASEVKLRFVENDYEVLRRFEQRSSLRTYLTVVIQRMFLDYRIRLWGKWRPSTEAKRLGDLAVLLERLLRRDGWTFEEAATILQTNHQVAASRQDLYELSLKLPNRSMRRRFAGEEEAKDVPSENGLPDAGISDAEQHFRSQQVHTALTRAVARLSPQEQLILTLRFKQSLSIVQIAKALHLDQKRLYRTSERLLARLRTALEDEGVSVQDIGVAFVEPSDLTSTWRLVGNSIRRPSLI